MSRRANCIPPLLVSDSIESVTADGTIFPALIVLDASRGQTVAAAGNMRSGAAERPATGGAMASAYPSRQAAQTL